MFPLFATGVKDTGGKFVAGVVIPLMLFLGAWRMIIHGKNLKQKIS
jgi:hypothetical protein